MRQFVLVTAVVASLVGAPSVFASESTPTAPEATAAKPAKPAKLAKDDPNRIVCTRETVVGSNRPEKVCHTVAERERMRDAASLTMRNDRGSDYQSRSN